MLPNHHAFGIDISKYDYAYNPQVRPIDFIIQRAGYGDGRGVKQDELFPQLYAQSQSVPIRGAYWYWSGYQPMLLQADMYLTITQGKGFKFHALDFERAVNPINKLSAEGAMLWMEYVAKHAQQKVVLYCDRAMYVTLGGLVGFDRLAEKELWISQWFEKGYYERVATGPRLPAMRKDWTLWQYGGDYKDKAGWIVPGYGEGSKWGVSSRDVDLDAFNGTVEEMRAWCGAKAPAKNPCLDSLSIEEIEAYLAERKGN